MLEKRSNTFGCFRYLITYFYSVHKLSGQILIYRFIIILDIRNL